MLTLHLAKSTSSESLDLFSPWSKVKVCPEANGQLSEVGGCGPTWINLKAITVIVTVNGERTSGHELIGKG